VSCSRRPRSELRPRAPIRVSYFRQTEQRDRLKTRHAGRLQRPPTPPLGARCTRPRLYTPMAEVFLTTVPSVSCRRCSPNAPLAKLEMLTAERGSDLEPQPRQSLGRAGAADRLQRRDVRDQRQGDRRHRRRHRAADLEDTSGLAAGNASHRMLRRLPLEPESKIWRGLAVGAGFGGRNPAVRLSLRSSLIRPSRAGGVRLMPRSPSWKY
jgi:hypothetical protein